MSLASALNRIDKRYAWSLLGFVLASVFGTLSLYTEFLRDRRPQVRFEVISDASVLDVRERLGNLEIIYDGVDIQKARKSLRVIVVRVTNEGHDDILKSHYDEKTPLGIRVLNGTLLRAEVLASSNNYLRDTLHVLAQAPDSAAFPPVILEAGEWFTVKSLILHADGTRPTIEAAGKIAGVREIRRVDSTEVAAEPSFLGQVFSGGPWVQAARLPAYLFGLFVLIVSVGVPFVMASGALAKRRRRQHVAQFKSLTKLELTEADEFIFERYIEYDLRYLQLLLRAVVTQRDLDHEVRRYEDQKGSSPASEEMERLLVSTQMGVETTQPMYPIADMQKSGFITKGQDGWQVDSHLKQTLDEFIRFLEIKRAT